jgi:hypothetical protein
MIICKIIYDFYHLISYYFLVTNLAVNVAGLSIDPSN